MENETIVVSNTDSGTSMEVVILNKRIDLITVVIGAGVHNVQCNLKPTRNGQAYVGSIMGREIVYQRSRDDVQSDLDHANPALKKSRTFKK